MKVIKSKHNYEIVQNEQKEFKNSFMNFVIFYFVILGVLYFKNIIGNTFLIINAIVVGILYFIIHTNNYYSGFILLFKIIFYNKYDFVQKASFYTIIEEEFKVE